MSITDDLEAVQIMFSRRPDAWTAWECGFLESIQERLENGEPLTPKQQEIFDRLWQEVVVQRRR